MRYRCCCFKKEYIFLLLFSSANRATATPVSYRRVCVRLYMYSYFCLLKLTNRSSSLSLSLSHSSLPFFYLCCLKEAGACVCQCEGEVRRQAERRWYFTTLFVTRRRGLPSSLFFFLLSSFFFLGVECFDRLAKEYYNKPEGRWSSRSTFLTSSPPTKTV